ncbi:MAG: alpha/beta fold hydrolase [Acidimicrobiales bacterium]
MLAAHTADGDVGYRTEGHGSPLVLIMGYSGSMDAWEPSFVDALARNHQVVVFDNAGIGKTAGLPAPLTITAMANQTAALITALHFSRADVLGWSMGGMIAQALAATHPGLVDHLVLCATLPGNGRGTPPSASAVQQLVNAGNNPAAALGLLFPPSQTAAQQRYVAGIVGYPGYYEAPAKVDAAQLGTLSGWVSGKEPAGARIGSISSPTLVADGTADVLVPVANDHTLVADIPGAQLVLYPGAGHAFMFQDEAAFLARLRSFLEPAAPAQ